MDNIIDMKEVIRFFFSITLSNMDNLCHISNCPVSILTRQLVCCLFKGINSILWFLTKIGLQDCGNGMLVYHLYNIQETITQTKSVPLTKTALVGFYRIILTGKEERTCTIPEGKAILVPLITGECDDSESPSQSDADLRQCSTEGDEYGAISATLDGQKIENLDSRGLYSNRSFF